MASTGRRALAQVSEADDLARKQKLGNLRPDFQGPKGSKHQGIKRKQATESNDLGSNSKKSKPNDSKLSAAEIEQQNALMNTAQATQGRSRSPSKAATGRSNASQLPTKPSAPSVVANSRPDSSQPVTRRGRSAAQEITLEKSVTAIEKVEQVVQTTTSTDGVSEQLFYKKHSKAAIENRKKSVPEFETEEEELDWMFPSLPTVASSLPELDALQARVDEMQSMINAQGDQIARLEELMLLLQQKRDSTSARRDSRGSL